MSKLRIGKYFLIQSRYNNMIVLEVNATQPSNAILLNNKIPDFLGNNDHQLWSFDQRNNTIRNKLSKKYLSALENQVTAELYQEGNLNYCWSIQHQCIRSLNGSNLVLTTDSNKVCSLTPFEDSLITQQWIIDNQPALFFYIKLKSNPSQVVDVKRDDRKPGAKVIIYDNKNVLSDNQLWCEDENGIIRSKLNDYAFDTSNGKEVLLQPYSRMNVQQQWTISDKFIQNMQMPTTVLQMRPASIFNSAYLMPILLDDPLKSNNTIEWITEYIPHQSITLNHSGCGKYFIIKSHATGLVFEVEEGNSLSGIKIKMQHQTNEQKKSLRQQFHIDEITGTVRSILRNFVIDTTDGYLTIASYDPFKKLQQWMFENNRLINKHNLNLVLQVENSQPDSLIIASQISEKTEQLWTLSYMPAKCFYIVSSMSGKVLDVRGDNADAGASIILYDRKSDISPNQLWYEDERGFIRSKLNGYVFDSSEKEMCVSPYNPLNVEQQWSMMGDRIQNRYNSKMVADVAGGAKTNNTRIIKYEFNGGDNQKWHFDYINL